MNDRKNDRSDNCGTLTPRMFATTWKWAQDPNPGKSICGVAATFVALGCVLPTLCADCCVLMVNSGSHKDEHDLSKGPAQESFEKEPSAAEYTRSISAREKQNLDDEDLSKPLISPRRK